MNNCIKRKTEYKKSAVILLSVFFFIRELLVSSDTKTGIFINPIAITITVVNAVYIILVAVYSIALAFALLKVYRSHDSLTAVPAILIAADPILPYTIQNCINLLLAILLLICFTLFDGKPIKEKAIIFAAFSAFSAFLSPVSLFSFIPISMLVFFLGNGKKAILPVIVSVFSFAVFSIIHSAIYESSYAFKNFIYAYSLSENREYNHSFLDSGNIDIASVISFIFLVFVTYLFFEIFKAKKNVRDKAKNKDAISDEIFNALITAVSFILTATGVLLFKLTASAFTLSLIVFIIFIKNGNKKACDISDKLRNFTDKNLFVLILLLAAMSVILLNLRSPGSVYSSAANYFT